MTIGARWLTFLLLFTLPHIASAGDKEEWTSLFNGKDLTGWDTSLGRGDKAIINEDPKEVYTVVKVDGKPAIRISGQIFGAITSKKEYANYHLKLQFKWGKKRWPPRANARRDSGLLYHCVGPVPAPGNVWMKSQELQIQEGDCGDYWGVAGAMINVEGYRKNDKGAVIYKKGGKSYAIPSKGIPRHAIKSPDNEKPSGEWNTIELFTMGTKSVHVVNGKTVMILTDSRHVVDGKVVPLSRGKLQIQSEGAEVYYRNLMIREIDAIPEKYLK